MRALRHARPATLAAALVAAAAASFAPAARADVADDAVPTLQLFGDKDGIPQSSVLAIAAEASGRMWIGTQGGAATYDGRAWTRVAFPSTAQSNTVNAIRVTRDGAVWLATDGGGLWRRARDAWTRFDTSSGLPDDHVLALEETKDGLWAGTSAGLARFDGARFVAVAVPSVSRVLALAGAGATLWVGGEGGLVRCDGAWCTLARASGGDGLPGKRVRAVLATPGALWVGTDRGLVEIAGERTSVFDAAHGALANDDVWSLAETVSGSGKRTLWIGTYGGGLARMVDGHFTKLGSASTSHPIDYVASLFASDGALGKRTLWIGTDGGGLARLRHDGWAGLSRKGSGLPGTGTFAIAETRDDGAMWFATDAGIGRFAGGAWTTLDVKKSGLPSDYVLALTPFSRDPGAMWIGTYDGLARLAGGKVSVVSPGGALLARRVHFLGASRDQSALYVGLGAGAAIRRGDAWEVLTSGASGLPEGSIRAIVETELGSGKVATWFGGDGGLARLVDGAWRRFDAAPALRNREILALRELDRVLWIGTAAGGVARFDLANDRWLESFDEKTRPALPDDAVYQVQADARGRVYLFTNRGVARLTPRAPTGDDPAPFSVYTFTTEDGLPSNECNSDGSFVDARGRIWAGTIAGAGVFDPLEEVEDVAPKTLALAPPRVGDGERLVVAGDALAHDANTVTFDYALHSLFRERDTRFRTQLVGFDAAPSEWTVDAKSKYTNLPEGSYTFRVWARDYAGNASGPVEIAFRVRPAPWRTWWAWIGYAIALVGVGYGGHRFRLRALSARNRELAERVAERTAQLDKKNDELAVKVVELDDKLAELARKNRELEESHRRADLIFSALADVLPGTLLDDKYRLEEKIGTGGFGAVFRATHIALGRAVAVKVFRPSPGNDSALALERFRLEGMSACRVDHPNAVQVFDSGISHEGIAYIVMELLQGRSVADELRDRTISLRRCAKILRATCDVLEVAHARGLVHRDIKPDNVFLHQGNDGAEQVKVVDFGIAKLLGYEPGAPRDVTATGGIIGTPSYMAPERFGTKPYDARSDVYSVGVTLFQMIAGSLPYPVGDRPVFDVVLRQLNEPPLDLKTLAPRVPDEAAAIVMRCLARDPGARPTLRELSDTFARAIDALPDAVKDEVIASTERIVSVDGGADEHAETVSYETATKRRTSRPPAKASRPPPKRASGD